MQLESSQVKKIYTEVKRVVPREDILDAFYAASEIKPGKRENLSISFVDEAITLISTVADNPEHLITFFGTLSTLVQRNVISASKLNEILNENVNNRKDRSSSMLHIEDDGKWILQWNIKNGEVIEIDSLPKFDVGVGYVVPEPIIEILNSAFLCLNEGALLSGLALVLVTLEPTLWDHLFIKGIRKTSYKIAEYKNSVKGCITWSAASNSIVLQNSDGSVKVPANNKPVQFSVNRKDFGTEPKFDLIIEPEFVDIFSDNSTAKEEREEGGKLATAIQRARKEGLINAWDRALDDSFRTLRNDIAHNSINYEEIKIKTPYAIINLSDLAHNRDVCLFFIRRIITYISDAYSELVIFRIDNPHLFDKAIY